MKRKKPNIHSKPDEISSFNQGVSNSHLENIHHTLGSIDESLRNPVASFTGLQGINDKQRETNLRLEEIGGAIVSQPQPIIQKLEEVKSAGIISNRLLKEIKDKPLPPPPPFPEFPKEMEVNLKGISVVTLKGDKGDKGNKGDKGDRGESVKGDRGDEGEPGKNGKDGKNVDENRLLLSIMAKVPPPEKGSKGDKGDAGSPDTPDEVVDKVNLAKKKISFKQIKDIPDFATRDTMNQVGEIIRPGQRITYLSNGVRINDYVTEINFSSNITPVYAGNGRITLTASGGGGTTYQETPVGAINSSNKVYTVANAVTTVINFAINGQYIHPAEYSAVGTTITFVTALDTTLSGAGFTIIYQ